MLLQVFSMTQEQINSFSETERAAILQLVSILSLHVPLDYIVFQRSQFMGSLNV